LKKIIKFVVCVGVMGLLFQGNTITAAPSFTSSPNEIATVNMAYSYTVGVTGSGVTVTGQTKPGWLSLETSQKYQVSTFAGNGEGVQGGYSGGPVPSPLGLAFDAAGTLYVTSGSNIKKVAPGGTISEFVSSSKISSGGFQGLTRGAVFDSSGNLYVPGNKRIKKITSAGEVSMFIDQDKGLNNLRGIVFDAASQAIYIADSDNFKIKKITLDGTVTTLAGGYQSGYGHIDASGTNAQFGRYFGGLAIGPDGYLYVGDGNNRRIRKVNLTTKEVTTFAGTGDPGYQNGALATATFTFIMALTFDSSGNLYVVDKENDSKIRIRKITPSGDVSTIAGPGSDPAFYIVRNGVGSNVKFASPNDIIVDNSDNLYVADTYNGAVRKIVNEITTKLTGTPSMSHFGSNPVVLAASSGGTTTTQPFNINVALANVFVNQAGNMLVGSYGDKRVRLGSEAGAKNFNIVSGVEWESNELEIGESSVSELQKLTILGILRVKRLILRENAEFELQSGKSLYVTEDIKIHGSRKMILNGTALLNTVDGGLSINAGGQVTALSVTGDINVASGGSVTVNNLVGNVVVTGAGTRANIPQISGAITLREGAIAHIRRATKLMVENGTFGPGYSPGRVDLVDATISTSNLLFELGGTTAFPENGPNGGKVTDNYHDVLVAQSVTLNAATIKIMLWNSFVPTDGDTFNIISANVIAVSGPVTFNLPPLSTGLVWDTSTVTSNGILKVKDAVKFISTPNLTVTVNMSYNHIVIVTGNNVTLTGQTMPNWLRLANVPDFKGVSSAATHLAANLIPGSQVSGMEFDSAGNLYFTIPAPTGEYKIYKLTPSGNLITVAGAGSHLPKPNVNQTYTTANATFYNPYGLAVDAAGNLYIADTYNHQIRKITMSTGIVSTFAGSGVGGHNDATGIEAQFNSPFNITIDSAGNLYVVDSGNRKVRKITPAGKVTTVGGSLQLAGEAHGLTAGNDGYVYVADTTNHRILKINVSTDVVTTLAGSLGNSGSNDGTGTAAKFWNPSGLTMDALGNLYVADRLNHRIRVITPEGVVNTLVGSGLTSFTHPFRVAIGPDGHAYVANLIGAGGITKITMTPMSHVKLLTGAPTAENVGQNPVVITASDGIETISKSFVITVINTPPSLDTISAQVVVEDTTKLIGLVVMDNETAVGSLNYSVTATNPTLWTSMGVVTSNVSASVQLVPSSNQIGTSQITIVVSDGEFSVTRSVEVTVTPVNDAPSFVIGTTGQTYYADEGTVTVNLNISSISYGPSDESGQQVSSYTVTSSGAAIFTGTPTVSNSGVLTFTLDESKSGESTVSVRLIDNGGTANGGISTSDPQTIVITSKKIIMYSDLSSLPAIINEPNEKIKFTGSGTMGSGKSIIASSLEVSGTTNIQGKVTVTTLIIKPGASLKTTGQDAVIYADSINGDVSALSESRIYVKNIQGKYTLLGTVGKPTTDGPGFLAGIRTQVGNYDVGENSIVEIEVDGQSPGSGGYDQYQIVGDMTIHASTTLNIIVSPNAGYTPPLNKEFIIAKVTGNITGSFGTVVWSGMGVYNGFKVTTRNVSGHVEIVAKVVAVPAFISTGLTTATEDVSYKYTVGVTGNNVTVTGTLPNWLQLGIEPAPGRVPLKSTFASSSSFNTPYSIAFDSNGNLYVGNISSGSKILKITPDGTVSTFANVSYASGLVFDKDNNLYVAVYGGNKVMKVTPAGNVTRFAGTGGRSFTGDDGDRLSASMEGSNGIAFDASGENLYIATSARIRKINMSTGIITTFAGNGIAASNGDDGDKLAASFKGPAGLAFDKDGNLYVGEYWGGNRIRKINMSTGIVTKFAGGTTAILNQPAQITFDTAGNLYVADSGNKRIQKITPAGSITTEATSSGALYSLALNTVGDIYFSDANLIKKITQERVSVLIGTPNNSNVGSHPVKLIASEGGLYPTSQSFSITVTNINDAPTLTTVSNITGAIEDTEKTISYASLITAANEADVDKNTIIQFKVISVSTGNLKVEGTPFAAGSNDILTSGKELKWTPVQNTNGTIAAFKIKAFDGSLLSATAVTVSVNVTSVNDEPTITGTPNTTVAEDSSYSFTPIGTDIDQGDTLTYSIENKPTWATFTAGTGKLTGTPTNSNVGISSNITISVSDGTATIALPVFNLAVTNTNDAPTLTTVDNITGAIEDTEHTITYANLITAANEADVDKNTTMQFKVSSVSTGNLKVDGTPFAAGSNDILTSGKELKWTPVQNTNGVIAAFKIKAFDGSLLSATAVTVSVNVTSVNDVPTITGTPNTTVAEDSVYSFTPVGKDDDNDHLTYSIQNKPTWATFTTSTGHLTGTPKNENVGTSSNIIISVFDSTVTTNLSTFSITVTNTNDAPTITGTPKTRIAEDSIYSFIPVGKDVDQGETLTLTYSIENKPTWATFTTTNGKLTGTPQNSDVGTSSNITISVSDGTVTTDLSVFNLAVTNINDAPTITGTPNTTVAEDSVYSFTPVGKDVDQGDTLTYSIQNKPSWTTFTTTNGQLTGTPTNENVGTNNNIIISVFDDTVTANLSTFSITVTNTNDAPTITGTPNTTAAEDSVYSFTPVGADIDQGDTLTYSIENKPSWATFTTTDGQLTGTPRNSDVGTSSNITISVFDSTVTTNLTIFNLKVTNTNDAPTITGTPNTTVAEDSTYSFTPVGADVDQGDTSTYSIQNKPTWATFTTTTGQLTGTPRNENVGTSNTILISVSDGTATATLSTFSITVTNTNDAPTITGTSSPTAAEDRVYSFMPVGKDVDKGETLTLVYSIQNKPTWATFTAGTGKLTGTPKNSDVRTSRNITISVSDGTVTTDLPVFNLAVTNTNDAPSFVIGKTSHINYADAGTVTVNLNIASIKFGPSNESGQQILRYDVSTSGSTLFTGTPSVSTSGGLTYTLDESQSGEATVSIRLIDNGGTANGGIATSSPQTIVITSEKVTSYSNLNSLPASINTPSEKIKFTGNGTIGSGKSIVAGSLEVGGNTEIKGKVTVKQLIIDPSGSLKTTGKDAVIYADSVKGDISSLAGARIYVKNIEGKYTLLGTASNPTTDGPGFSPGIRTQVGNYDVGKNSIVEIEVEGATPGQYDQYQIVGDMTIHESTTLKIIVGLNAGYTPTINKEFIIAKVTGNITGSFDKLEWSGLGVHKGINITTRNIGGHIELVAKVVTVPNYISTSTTAGKKDVNYRYTIVVTTSAGEKVVTITRKDKAKNTIKITVVTTSADGNTVTTTQKDKNGNTIGSTVITTSVDGNTVTTTQKDKAGNTIGSTVITTSVDGNTVTTIRKDKAGNVIGSTVVTTSADGNTVTTIRKDKSGNVIGSTVVTTSADGNTVTTTQKDKAGNVIGITTAATASNGKPIITTQKDKAGNVIGSTVVTTSSDGKTVTTTQRDKAGNVIGSTIVITSADGRTVTTIRKDKMGNVIGSTVVTTSADGNTVTTIQKDNAENVLGSTVVVTSTDGKTVTTIRKDKARNVIGSTVVTTSADEKTVTTTRKDKMGNVIGSTVVTTSADGKTVTTTRKDKNGNTIGSIVVTTSADEKTVTTTRKDKNGNDIGSIVVTTSADENTVTTTRKDKSKNIIGITVVTTSADGKTVTTTQKDNAGNVIGITIVTTSADGNTVTTTQKDKDENVIGSTMVTTSADRKTVTTTQKDKKGNVIGSTMVTTSADGNTVSTTQRNKSGNVIGSTVVTTLADGNTVTTTQKDKDGNIIGSTVVTTSADGKTVTTTRKDKAGNVIGITTVTTSADEKTVITTRSDGYGNILGSTVVTTSADERTVTTTQKDKDGNVIGRTVAVTSADEKTVITTMKDSNGQVIGTKEAVTSGNKVVTVERNVSGTIIKSNVVVTSGNSVTTTVYAGTVASKNITESKVVKTQGSLILTTIYNGAAGTSSVIGTSKILTTGMVIDTSKSETVSIDLNSAGTLIGRVEVIVSNNQTITIEYGENNTIIKSTVEIKEREKSTIRIYNGIEAAGNLIGIEEIVTSGNKRTTTRKLPNEVVLHITEVETTIANTGIKTEIVIEKDADGTIIERTKVVTEGNKVTTTHYNIKTGKVEKSTVSETVGNKVTTTYYTGVVDSSNISGSEIETTDKTTTIVTTQEFDKNQQLVKLKTTEIKGKLTKVVETVGSTVTTIMSTKGALSIDKATGKLSRIPNKPEGQISYYDLSNTIPKNKRKKILETLEKTGLIKNNVLTSILNDTKSIPNLNTLIKLINSNTILKHEGLTQASIELISNNYNEIKGLFEKIIKRRTTKVSVTVSGIELKQGDLIVETISDNLIVSGGTLNASGPKIRITIAGDKQLTIGKGATVKIGLGNTVSGNILQLNGGRLSIQGTANVLNPSIVSGGASSAPKATPTCKATYQLFQFKTIRGRFDELQLPSPSDGCEWDTKALYTTGELRQYVQSSIGAASVNINPKITSLLARTVGKEGLLRQGKGFKVGINYNNFTSNDYLELHIFDILGQLHVKKTVLIGNLDNAAIGYGEVKIEPYEFHHMSVGAYIMTISYEGKVQAKTKIGVVPADK
jgi:hypothetical protein